MNTENTAIIVPTNDPEAILIAKIAEGIGLDVMISEQPHGATLGAEEGIVERVREGGWKRVAIVEMPGTEAEEAIRALGVEVEIIDHHAYGDLDRSVGEDGSSKPSSLEQFIATFQVSEEQLRGMGLDPRKVRGIELMDAGYVWALYDAGYSKDEARELMAWQDELMGTDPDDPEETRRREAAREAWDGRDEWHGFAVISHGDKRSLRDAISRLIALEVGEPKPLILEERPRDLVYVQESEHAQALHKEFGGFTYGTGRNWGYRNEAGNAKIGIAEIKAFLEPLL